jgi:hypothetical protein
MTAWHVARAEASLREAGARLVEVQPIGVQAHVMGTARMGLEPATSVVDGWCMAHDVPNLGIIDGSVFVTAGGVNPTCTISALALRTADHLVERRHDLPVPEPPAMTAHVPIDLDARAHRLEVLGTTPSQTPHAEIPAPVPPLSDQHRAVLSRVSDRWIPAGSQMPSGGEVGVAWAHADWVLCARPDLAEPLQRALDATDAALSAQPTPNGARHRDGRDDDGDGDALERVLRDLEAGDPAAHQALVVLVFAAYYHDADVRRRIGYPGQVPRPVSVDGFPEYVAEGLLDHLLG